MNGPPQISLTAPFQCRLLSWPFDGQLQKASSNDFAHLNLKYFDMISVSSSHILLFVPASRFEAGEGGGGDIFHDRFGLEIKLSSCARLSSPHLTKLNLLPPVFLHWSALYSSDISPAEYVSPGGPGALLKRLNGSGAATSLFKSCSHDAYQRYRHPAPPPHHLEAARTQK